MKLHEVIALVDDQKPNAFSTLQKVKWLEQLDGHIAAEDLLMNPAELQGISYSEDELDTELLIKKPYDDIYPLWLAAQIDFANGEYEKYQNSMALYNAQYGQFACWFAEHFETPPRRPPRDWHGFYYLTAYGYAVMQGFKGTEAEWLASLKGEAGEAGKNFTVLGHYDTLELLQAAVPDPETGDAYSVGTVTPYNVYLYGDGWEDYGAIQGPKGDPFTYDDFTPEQLEALTGPAGKDGKNGRDGQDGISPTVAVETVSDGHQVTITDAEGPHSFAVTDGKDGYTPQKNVDYFDGEDGYTPVKNVDYFDGEDAPIITSITRTSGTGAPGTTDTYTVNMSDGTTAGTFEVYNGANGTGAGDMTAAVYDPQGKVTDVFQYVDEKLEGVSVTTDATPTQDSTNPVQSGGVYDALAGKQNALSGNAGQVVGFDDNGKPVAQDAPSGLPVDVQILEVICKNLELTPEANSYTFPEPITLDESGLYWLEYVHCDEDGPLETYSAFSTPIFNNSDELYVGWFDDFNSVVLTSASIADDWQSWVIKRLSIYKVSVNTTDYLLFDAMGGEDRNYVLASGVCSHAEGKYTSARGECSHAEGCHTRTRGECSHAEGVETTANGSCSHAEGWATTAGGNYSHVQGVGNIEDFENRFAHIVGNGVNSENRSNAHTLDWSGNAWFAGDVYVGSTSGTNKDDGSKKLATVDEVSEAVQNVDAGSIKFSDGETFQQKLDAGELKGDKGDSATINGVNALTLTAESPIALEQSGGTATLKFNGSTGGIPVVHFTGEESGNYVASLDGYTEYKNGDTFVAILDDSSLRVPNLNINGLGYVPVRIPYMGTYSFNDSYPCLLSSGTPYIIVYMELYAGNYFVAIGVSSYDVKWLRGTFSGIVKASSSDSSDQAPATSLLRNSKLVATETTPTVNGEIFWVYG